MRDDIRSEVLANIKRDYGFGDLSGDWLPKGRCPQCGKKELWTSGTKPWVLRCGRLNRCGWEGHVKDLYPEIFDNWSNRYQASEANPNAAADAYLLHSRGLDLQFLRGSYSQEHFADQSLRASTATVRFSLPGGSWWERFIDQPSRFGKKKGRFAYGKSYRGEWWQHPLHTLDDLAQMDEIWIAEGIFDTCALVQAFRGAAFEGSRFAAVSAMSTTNYPSAALDRLRKAVANGPTPTKSPKLVWAFDIGKAGTEATVRYHSRAKEEGWESTAAQPRPEGEDDKLDWNDLLQRDRITPDHVKDYLWHGKILLADDPMEKAFTIWSRHQRRASFPFTFNHEQWWAEFSLKKIDDIVKELNDNPEFEGRPIEEVRTEAAKQAGAIQRICNASFRILYFQRNPATEDSHYYVRVDFPVDRQAVKAPFSGGAVAASAEFKKRLISVAPGAIWRGSGDQLDRLLEQQTRRIMTVETLDATGYDAKRQVYVLGDIAVRRGRVHELNAEDFFDLGDCALKLGTTERLIQVQYDADKVPTEWFPVVVDAFGENGLITVAFWMMSLFAEQIRALTKSLAFLEASGLPGTGKSTLIEFMWKVSGRDGYEGFDPTKGSAAAIGRNLAKVSNLPVVLIEGDRNESVPHSKRFEWEELKPIYNGRVTRSRGVKNGGNETYEPPFRGSIIIAQNDPVSASPAVLERIMSLHFDKSRFSPETKAAAERLERWPVEDVSGFLIHALRREEEFLAIWKDAYTRYFDQLQAETGVGNIRLLRNHAQLAAALAAMRCILPVSDGLLRTGLNFIAEMTKQRQLITASEHPTVEKFWQIFDYLVEIEAPDVARPLNNARKADQEIAVSLPQFFERCRAHGQTPPPEDDLRRHLKASKARKFIGQKSVNSPSGKFFHCWVFQRPVTENPVI